MSTLINGSLVVKTRQDILDYCTEHSIQENDFNEPTLVDKSANIFDLFCGCASNYDFAKMVMTDLGSITAEDNIANK